MYSKAMRILLMFCYFLVLVTGISCRENPADKTTVTEETEKTPNNSQAKTSEDKLIMFFGNSLTAGMGLDTEDAFPELIQDKLDSLELSYQVINAGLSGETTASGKNRLEWVLNQKIDVFVLELGANDGLRGVPLNETRNNLQAIIDFVREKNPDVKIVLAGMQIPPNLGTDYTVGFRKIFPELADKNNVELIPFLLQDVAGIPELNQGDGIHPNEEGQKIVAQNVWEVLKEIL